MTIRLLPEALSDVRWNSGRRLAQLISQCRVTSKAITFEDCRNCTGGVERMLENFQFFEGFGAHTGRARTSRTLGTND